MGNIGNLYFKIGGDDKELKKIFEDRKKDAVELQRIFSSMKFGSQSKAKDIADVVKLQEKQNRMIVSNTKAEMAQSNLAAQSIVNQQRVADAFERSRKVRLGNIKLQNELYLTEQRVRTETEKTEAVRKQQLLTSARLKAMEKERSEREILNQQRLLTEIQRTEAARRRASLAGITNQNNLNHAINLTNRTFFNQRALLQQLAGQLGIYFSVIQVGRFVKELAMVSGEFEKQRLSLAAILRDKEAANRIFGQIKDLAIYSPFNFMELTDFAKQLSAFSIPANELFDTMKRLADVSAGLGVDMRRIVLAYGQIRSAAVLRGQEVRQMSEAGIPVIDELAKKFEKLEGKMVSAGEVFDKISKREVPFSMIKEMFWDMTNEGGKFFEMQEVQARSLAGMISNLRDAFDIMLDSIGEANRDMLKGFVGGLVKVMDNWEKYWNILKGIIITYGTYKAAVIAATTGLQVLAKAQRAYNLLMLSAAIGGSKLGMVVDVLTLKFNNLSKATKFGLILSAIVAIGYAIKTASDNADKLNKELNEIAGKVKADADASALALDNLLIRLKNTNKYSSEYRTIIEQINKQYGDFLPNLIKESESYDEIEKKLKGVTAAIYEKAKAQSYTESIQKIESNLSEAMSKAYDSSVKSLTTKKMMGYGQYVLSKEDANKVVAEMFAAIRQSPEIYKNVQEVEKLISDSMTKALKGRTSKTSFAELYNIQQLDGMIEGVKSYAEAVSDVPAVLQDAFDKNEAITGLNMNYALSIEQIQIKYGQLNDTIRNTPDTTPELVDEKLLQSQIDMLEEMQVVYEKFGQSKLAGEKKIEIEKLKGLNKGWRAELNNAFNHTINIQPENNFNEIVDEMKKKYKEVRTRLDEEKPILVKLKFDFEKNEFPVPLLVTDSMKELRDSYLLALKDKKNIEAGTKLIGMELKDLYTPKEKSVPKDKFTEDLKRQVDLMRDAKKQYDDLKKTMSADDAYKNLTSIDEYKKVKLDNITDEGYVIYLREQLKKIEGKNSDTAKNVRITWNKELGSIQIETITKDAEKELKKIEKFLSQYKDKYNLYEQLFQLTGDKGQSAEIAFGNPSETITTYIDAMKAQLKNMSGGGIYDELLLQDQTKLPEAVRDMVENIRQAIQEKDFALKIDMAKVVSEYATVQNKINAIHNQYEKKREEARNSGAPEEEISRALSGYDRAEAEAVKELQTELLQLTPFYRQLFGDLSDISYRHLKKMVENAKGIVSTIAEKKNEDGTLTYGKYDRNKKLEGYYLPNEDGSKSDTFVHLKEYERLIKRIASIQKDMRKQNPFDSLMRPFDSKDYEFADGTQMDKIDILASKAADLKEIVSSVTGDLSGMFDALGNEDAADTTAFIGEMVGAASNVAMGIASGNPVQMIQGIIGGITAIAKNHDAKLDKAIKKSQTHVKNLKNEYSELQRVVERQLGAITRSQAKQQVENLEQQKRELESQRRNEINKKKTDWNTVADYENQINEIRDQIRYFYEDLAGEQFGVKIKDWAKNISDALVDAWSKGEDAAKAFDSTVADIMKSVFKNILQLQYIEPAMAQLRTYLFGTDGKSGILGDGEMSRNDMVGLVGELTNLKGKIGEWQNAWNYLVEAAKQAGINLEDMTSGDSLTKGIQAVTEDTANLLASYINAMRADLSIQKSMVEKIMLSIESSSNTFALMQADIMKIQINTLATANNTSKLIELSEDTNNLLRRASTTGSGIKFNIS